MKKLSLILLMVASVALFSCKSSNSGTGTDRNGNTNQGMRNGNTMQNGNNGNMQDQNKGSMQDNTGTTTNDTYSDNTNTTRTGTGNMTGTDTNNTTGSMNTNTTGNDSNKAGGTINDTSTYSSDNDNSNDYNSVQDAVLGKKMDDMYGQLDMTKDQISRYHTVSNKRMDDMKYNGNDRSSLNRDTLIKNQDADMKQVLSPEQYTNYQSLVKDYYPDVNGKSTSGRVDNNN